MLEKQVARDHIGKRFSVAGSVVRPAARGPSSLLSDMSLRTFTVRGASSLCTEST